MTQTVVCAHCHQPVLREDRFCGACGKLLFDDSTVVVADAATAPPSRVAQADAELLHVLRDATAGEYDVFGEIGRGGMAVVYLAHDLALDRKVAIKVLLPALLHSEGMAERFKNEAQTAARLSHVNIIPIFAVRETNKLVFFVMKFVAGKPLDELLAQMGGPMPIPITLALLWQIGRALAHAHQEGVYHRDVKPGNILVDTDGSAIVMDFGIAKRTDLRGMTMTGTTMGTPYYMSPEQCKSEPLTSAADQYSLGIMAYEMLAGHVPFRGGSAMETMNMNCYEPVPPLAEARPDCPLETVQAVHRMLEKKAEDRFETVDDALVTMGAKPLDVRDPARKQLTEKVREGRDEFLARVQTPRSPVPAAHTPWPASGPGLRSVPAVPPQPPQSRDAGSRRWRIAGGIIVLGAVGGFGGWWFARPKPPPPAQGVVVVTDLPAGAQLFINGQARDGSPVALDPGAYEIRLTVPGYRPIIDTVTVSGGDTTAMQMMAGAVRETQRVVVAGLPRGAEIRLDGAMQADTVFEVTPGTHTIEMSASGLVDDVRSIDVQPGSTVTLAFERVPAPLSTGTVAIGNLPSNGTVTVDGRGQRGTRFTLSPGRHTIVMAAPGYRSDTQTIQVREGALVTLQFSRTADDRDGILQLRISPAAELEVDGVSRGVQNQLQLTLRPGVNHLLKFRREGYLAKDTTVTLAPGQTVQRVITLTPGSP